VRRCIDSIRIAAQLLVIGVVIVKMAAQLADQPQYLNNADSDNSNTDRPRIDAASNSTMLNSTIAEAIRGGAQVDSS